MRDKKISNIKKILAIRNDKIGDMVLSSKVIDILKKKFPKAKLDLIVSTENKSLIEASPSINKIYVLNYSPRTPQDFFKYFQLSKKIRKEKYDLGVEIRGSFFNILFLLWMAGVNYKVGFYTNRLSRLLLDSSYVKDYKGHATENMLKMINRGLGTNFHDSQPKIFTSKTDKAALEKFLRENKISKSIIMCVDASNNKKQWPLDKFDNLIRYIHKKHPSLKILLVGIDRGKMDFLLKKNPYCIGVFKQNLRLLYLLFGKSNLVIGPDGGTMHLAWVSKAPTITFIPPYLKGYLEDIRPLGKNARIILKRLDEIQEKEVISLMESLLPKF